MSRPTTPAAAPLAVIDIGSSAIRMEVAEVTRGGALRSLESLQRAVPLGHESFSTGRIGAKTINLAIEVLRGYLKILKPYEVGPVRAVATSAVREAANQELFVERVYMATGLEVEVLSGAEKDRLLYAAVDDAFGREGLTVHQDSLIVEQGAGSIDIAVVEGGEVVNSGSFPLGTIRLSHAVAAGQRGGADPANLLKRYVGAALDHVEHAFPLERTRNFVVVGGDARFAAEHLAEGGSGRGREVRAVSREDFLRFAREAARLKPAQVAARYRIPFEECEALGPALLTYAELLKRTPAETVLVPSVSMRDGLLLELAAERTGRRQSALDGQTYASAENLGRRYQFDEAHARHVADLACALFDALSDEHGLDRRERRLLRVSALLHDVGLFIGSNGHHKHSEYIIGASDLFGVRAEERAMVACIARYHRRALPQPTHPGYASLPREARATVSKLAALLRIADAMDRAHSQAVQLVSAQLGADELSLKVAAHGDLALERLAVRSKADLFEEVFGRKVVLQQVSTTS